MKLKIMSLHNFETNIPELICKLGINLYNDPMVVIRELVQNANDACIIAEGDGFLSEWRIDIQIDSDCHELIVTDNGIGMTEDDLKKFLSTIASSNKAIKRKELDEKNFKAARGIAGQFGIGFLSTFIIAERIEIKTRHQNEKSQGTIWVSSGDGHYTLEKSNSQLPKGTTIKVIIKQGYQNKINPIKITEALNKYCPYIRTPYYFNNSHTAINNELPPWNNPDIQGIGESYLRSTYQKRPLIEFYIKYEGDVLVEEEAKKEVVNIRIYGYLAIPDKKLWNEYPHVYTSGLYVGDFQDGLPLWAKFLIGGIECPDLDLTLGRDNVMKNTTWNAVKQIVETQLKVQIISNLSNNKSRIRQKWKNVFGIHGEKIFRAAVDDYNNTKTRDFYKAVKDIVLFSVGEEKLSIKECRDTNKCLQEQGQIPKLFYHSVGTRNHESSGIQETILFDEMRLHFIDAENFYERDFLEIYKKEEKSISLIPVNEGVEYILNRYNQDQESIKANDKEIIKEIFRVLGLSAQLSKFEPDYLPGVIILDYGYGYPNDRNDDIRAIIELISQYSQSSDIFRPYTLCVNANNILVQELLKYAHKHGVDQYIRSSFNQIYLMSVLVFGDTNTNTIAQMVPGLSNLMLSSIQGYTKQEKEIIDLRKMVKQEREEKENLITKLSKESSQKPMNSNEPKSVFLSYGYDEETMKIVKPFKRMLKERGIKIIDGKVDQVGSLSKQIISRIRECSMFVGVLTPRSEIKDQETSLTSIWVIEEKGVATAFGLPVLLIVDKNVSKEFFNNIEGDAFRLVVKDSYEWTDRFMDATEMIAKELNTNSEEKSDSF